MSQQKIKLIIWDFDGVIADTAKLWLLNRQKLINEELNLPWNFAETNKHLGGMTNVSGISVAILNSKQMRTRIVREARLIAI